VLLIPAIAGHACSACDNNMKHRRMHNTVSYQPKSRMYRYDNQVNAEQSLYADYDDDQFQHNDKTTNTDAMYMLSSEGVDNNIDENMSDNQLGIIGLPYIELAPEDFDDDDDETIFDNYIDENTSDNQLDIIGLPYIEPVPEDFDDDDDETIDDMSIDEDTIIGDESYTDDEDEADVSESEDDTDNEDASVIESEASSE